METNFLNNILLVADSGSIAEAARRLNITPAAIAQQIQALERELNVKLFKRVGRSVVPTEAGYRVLTQANEVIKNISQLKAVALANEIKGELRIGAINTALLSMIPNVLMRFIEQYPDVRIIIKAGTSLELYRALQQGELDVIICLHPKFTLSKEYYWQLLREEPLVVLAPIAYKDHSPHELLKNLPFIRYDRTLGGGKQADTYLRKEMITPHELFELNSILAIALMIEGNLGVSLIPDINSPLIDKLRVIKICLPKKTDSRSFGLIWHRASVRSHLIAELTNIAKHMVIGN